MRNLIGHGLPFLLLVVLSMDATGQTVPAPGDIGVATSNGFWRVRQSALFNHLAPSAFNPAFTTLVTPRLDWERGTNSFLLCTGSNLYRVTMTSSTTTTVTNLKPNVGGTASFVELDIHPGTGDLYLLDQLSELSYRFSPPFALNMVPNLVLPTDTAIRAMCLDSRNYPPSLTIATNSQVNRWPLDGAPPIVVTAGSGGGGLDGNPRDGRSYLVNKNLDRVDATAGTSLLEPLNTAPICNPLPLGLGPTNVAYDPTDHFAYALAEDGINPVCLAGFVGGNHIVALADFAALPPFVVTNPNGSGITGSNGDLAVVLENYAFLSPYGFGCEAPSTGQRAVLDGNTPPIIGSSTFRFEITDAPPNTAIYMLFGFQPASQTLPSGCTLLVTPSQQPFLIGTTDGNGDLTVPTSIPPTTPPGLQTYQQCAFTDSGATVLSNGLLLHFSP